MLSAMGALPLAFAKFMNIGAVLSVFAELRPVRMTPRAFLQSDREGTGNVR